MNQQNRRTSSISKQRSRASFETLETRQMLSASVIRIATYNIEADINGVTTPRSGLYQVLEGMGEEKVQGNVRPLDILGLEETTSNSTTVAPIVSNLNSYYNGAAVYAQSTYQATEDGGDNADGNGPNDVVYNTLTLNLVASVGVGTPKGSSNGEYRQVVRYEFQPVGDTGSTGVFYMYVSHMKSGSTSADATSRGQEATIIRNDEATLPAGSSVLYTGDLNSNPPEAEFTNFEAGGPGEAYDPLGFPSGEQYLSDSSTGLRYRDDYELVTGNILNNTGNVNYITGSLHSFGNNGSTSDPASSSNTALNSDLVQDGGALISASTLYGDLGTASDHLPVMADYTLGTGTVTGTPTIGSFAASPTTVALGGSTTLTASNVAETGGSGSVTGVNFYRESNGTSGLQIGSDILVGAGTQSGSNWSINTSTSGLGTAGSYTYYAVATDSNGNSSPTSTTTLNVTGVPSVNSLTVNPASVTGGTTVTLSANTVTDTGSTIRSVAFYLESNGTPGLQIGSDTLLGSGTQSGITWTLSNVSTSGLAGGTYTYYAVATDASGASSSAASTTLVVTVPPTIGSFSDSPSSVVIGATTTLTASNVAESGGTISNVKFYLESNGTTGLQIGSDTLIGTGTQSGSTWTINTPTTGFAAGTYTYYAVATDSTGVSSSVASTTLTATSPPQPLADISILASTSPSGPFSSNLAVTVGETVYYEVVGQLAPVGTSNDSGTKPYTITSETAHPGVGTTGYDGIQSVSFGLGDSGAFTIAFGSSALSTNASTGDNWSAGSGTSPGVVSGAALSSVFAALPSGVFGGATSAESIVTGTIVVPASVSAGSSSTIGGAFTASGSGALAINSNPATGSSATKIPLTSGDPHGYFGFTPLQLTVVQSLPAWLASNSQATWNSATKTLTVTGPSTIIADPGSDEPNIVANGSAAQLVIAPASTTPVDIHVAGITLTNGAGITVSQLDVPTSNDTNNNGEYVQSNHHTNHNVLVIGVLGAANDPTFSVDAASKLNLEDNDLIVHTGSNDANGYSDLTAVQLLTYGTNGAGGGRAEGAWNGDGLTSSVASAQDANDGLESVQLAVVDNTDLNTAFSTWQVGSASETLGGSDIIVKYTYTGDFTLAGSVGRADTTILGAYFDSGVSTGNEWAFGDCNDDGLLTRADITLFGADYGNGTAAGNDTYVL